MAGAPAFFFFVTTAHPHASDVRVFRLAHGNPGQHRVLTDGVVELKIDHGPGLRVYFTRRGAELVLLLAGGDKSSQQQDIETAIRLAKEISS